MAFNLKEVLPFGLFLNLLFLSHLIVCAELPGCPHCAGVCCDPGDRQEVSVVLTPSPAHSQGIRAVPLWVLPLSWILPYILG